MCEFSPHTYILAISFNARKNFFRTLMASSMGGGGAGLRPALAWCKNTYSGRPKPPPAFFFEKLVLVNVDIVTSKEPYH